MDDPREQHRIINSNLALIQVTLSLYLMGGSPPLFGICSQAGRKSEGSVSLVPALWMELWGWELLIHLPQAHQTTFLQ